MNPSPTPDQTRTTSPQHPVPHSEWMTVKEAAQYARCGTRSIYLAVANGRLRAARLNGRKDLRISRQWVDDFLVASSTPVVVN